MIQQTKNQFTDGLNLDVHPIAMNNLLLSSALNATMITMNGNELVLQNDMGNGRVESAHLPAGFVPVGMKEFGGIVYVASHNPLTGLSLIGSFPSPERNISTDEVYSGRNLMFSRFSNSDNETREIILLSQKLALSNGDEAFTIRPGDKFSIDMNETYVSDEYNFDELFESLIKFTSSENPPAKLSVCTLNSNNLLVEIKNLDANYEYSFDNIFYNSFVYNKKKISNIIYNIYKEKLIGDLYLKLTLNVPDAIEWFVAFGDYKKNGISDNKEYYYIYVKKYNNIKIDSSCIKIIDSGNISITTNLINENNRTDLFKESYDLFEIEIDRKTLSDGTSNFHNITITPFFNPEILQSSNFYKMNSGFLPKLSSSLSIDLTKIGTNAVEFNIFRYYNNTTNNNIIFNYGITSYLTSYINDTVNLCLVEYQDGIFNNEIEFELCNDEESFDSSKHYITVELSDSSIGYGNILNYQVTKDFTTLFKKNKIYIAILQAKYRSYQTNENNDYEYKSFNSKPFLLFTSEIANYLFVSNLKLYVDASSSNNIGTVLDDYLGIPCEIKYDYTFTKPDDTLNEDNSLYVEEYNQDKNILYTESCGGNLKFVLNPKVDIQLPKGCPLSKNDFITDCSVSYSGQGNITKTYTKTKVGNISSNLVKDGTNTEEFEIGTDNTFSGGILKIKDTNIYNCSFESIPIRKKDETVYGKGLLPYLDSLNRNSIFLQTIPEFSKIIKDETSIISCLNSNVLINPNTNKLLGESKSLNKIRITYSGLEFWNNDLKLDDLYTTNITGFYLLFTEINTDKTTEIPFNGSNKYIDLDEGTYKIEIINNTYLTIKLNNICIFSVTDAVTKDAYHITRWLAMSTYSGNAGSHSRYTVNDIDLTKCSSTNITYHDISTNYPNIDNYIPSGDDDGVIEIFSIQKSFNKSFNYVIKDYKESFETSHPLIGFILAYKHSSLGRSVFHVGSDNNNYRLNVCIPMLPTEDGEYYPLNEIGYAVCNTYLTDSTENKDNLITKLINFYSNNGYIVQNNIPKTVSYLYSDKDRYVYNPQYDITYSIGLDVTPSIKLVNNLKFRQNGIIQLTKFQEDKISLKGFIEDDENISNKVKLPEFILLDKNTNTILKTIENQTIDFTISSCDILDEVTTYLSLDGSNSLIFAEIDNTLYYSDCDGNPFRENKIYFLILKNGIKYLCPNDKLKINSNYMKDEDYPNECLNTILKLCEKFNDETLKIKRINSFNDKYGIYINKTNDLIGKGNDGSGCDRIGNLSRSFRSLSGAVDVLLINKPSFGTNNDYLSW